MNYDAKGLRRFFDAYGTEEWRRLEDSLPGRIKYAVHRHVLDRYIAPGLEVLDLGCGPGRYARHMAAAGAHLTLADISETQLSLAKQTLSEAGLADRVRSFERLDALSLSGLQDGVFDIVVCYGSVLSYLCERHSDGLRELIRVVRSGGLLLVSVTSLQGTLRLIGTLDAAAFIEQAEDHLDWQGVMAGADIVLTKVGSTEFHQPMALFTAKGLTAALEQAGLAVLELATSNPLTPVHSALPRLSDSPAAAERLEALEVALCRSPGLIDAGDHLIAAARKP